MNGGTMKSASAAALIVAALLLPVAIYSESPSPGPDPTLAPATIEEPVNPFLSGEQLIGLSAGFHIPVFLTPVNDQGVDNLSLGGSFSFSYQYFVARGFSIGGNIAGAFNGTIGGKSVFIAPLGATASYWWTKLPFEFSVLGEAGGFLMRYNGEGMLDPFLKAGGGAYWRASSSWSLGLQAYLWFVPEIHYGNYSELSQYSGFVETSIAAVYHL
jgi:hypothetical protein